MKHLYRGGKISPLLHDIDATNWIALGWSETPPGPSPGTDDDDTLPTKPDHITNALALINGTDVARDMAIIPTVGQAAARIIIERRPEGGYESLADVWERCPELLIGRFKVDPDAVESWGAG
jgi:hypothetical protein